ncbi:unnamed protein product [Acanthoscelides obtectus]|uniref:DDE-1 domain-containing protein n=1 Tax=Acanthoscelides obtectus TaxID=200917 RepID=A0A9P0Q5V6_ACAOB|nr:unnamed protein product [Acanthoscelides obtectus]CAK1670577.1 Pogo transposable element with KRAB domain [Acanthoscelides obtectus]
MIRNYIRKKAPPAYSKNDLKEAVQAVQRGTLTLYRAALLYKIPKATLFTHVKDKRGIKSNTGGRAPALPYDVEQKFSNSIKILEKWGMGLSKREVLQLIGRYVKDNNIVTPFKNGVPGNDYFVRFTKAFHLSQKKPQSVEVARKRSMDPFVMYDYFNILKQHIENIPASQIYNIDETGFCLDPSRIKVVGEKGRAAHRTTSGPARENITVLLGGNAAGEKLPPLVVFKGKHIWNSWIPTEEYPGMTYSATKNGWMKTETFQKYFENIFLPNIGKDRPTVLIYDGHTSHISISLIEKAIANDVIIVKLPPHSSHLLQPMDLCVFKSLKMAWDAELIKWQRQNYGTKLPKPMFCTILSKIWSQVNPSLLIKGFEKGGIYPFNNEVIPVEHYDPEAYKRWCDSNCKNNNPEEAQVAQPNLRSTLEERFNLPSTSTVPSITPQTSSVNSINPEMPSTSSEHQNPPVNNTTSFESILLEQLKQMPKPAKSIRKRVCIGAEVITSLEAVAKLNEKANKIKKPKKSTTKKDGKKLKRKQVYEEDTDEDSFEEMEVNTSDDDFDLDDEVNDLREEEEFVKYLEKDPQELKIGDWILVKFATKKSFKFYVGQVTEVEPCLEAKFARRSGSSSQFHWPDTPDVSVIRRDEIQHCLPAPDIHRRGHFHFNITFEQNIS